MDYFYFLSISASNSSPRISSLSCFISPAGSCNFFICGIFYSGHPKKYYFGLISTVLVGFAIQIKDNFDSSRLVRAAKIFGPRSRSHFIFARALAEPFNLSG